MSKETIVNEEQQQASMALDAAIDEAPAAGTDENTTGQAPESDASQTVTPEFITTLVVDGLADFATASYPFLQYPSDVRAAGKAKLLPVLRKYNISAPFLDKWAAEIECGMFFGGLIFGAVVQIREYKAAMAATEVKQTGASNDAGN